MRLSEIIKKPILFLFEAKLEGEITGALISRKTKRLEYLILEGKVTSYIKADKVISFGQDAVTVMNDYSIVMPSEISAKKYFAAAFGTLFTSLGERLGELTDIVFGDTLIAETVEYNGDNADFSRIVRMNYDLTVLYDKGCPTLRKVAPKKVKITAAPQKVVILEREDAPPPGPPPSVEDPHITLRTTVETLEKAADEHVPLRIISDYGFLLGRRVTANIFSFNRDLIVEEGEVITTRVVERARKYGKLVELTLNSKSVL